MVFLVPRSPLTPSMRLTLGLDPACRVVPADQWRLLCGQRELVSHAQQQAEQIVSEAQEAFEAQQRRGYEEGLAQARLEQAEQMIETVARRIDYFAQVEGRMVDLVMEALQKIIDDFDDRQRIVLTVRKVLSVVRNQKQMTLRLCPQDVDTVKAQASILLADYPGVGLLDIVADNRLKSGACILESEIGMVEASIDSQMQALRQAFQKVLGSRV